MMYFSVSIQYDFCLQLQKYLCLSYLLGQFFYRIERMLEMYSTPLLYRGYQKYFNFRGHINKKKYL